MRLIETMKELIKELERQRDFHLAEAGKVDVRITEIMRQASGGDDDLDREGISTEGRREH